MTAHILSQDEHFSLFIKDGAGVQTAGLGEGFLGSAELGRQRGQQLRTHQPVRCHGWKAHEHTLNARLPTDTATGGAEDMAGEMIPIHHDGTEQDIDDVAMNITRAGALADF